MRVDLGLLLLLLALCGSGAQGDDGGLGEEWTKQTTKQTTTDIWAEVRALRDMVVKLEVELKVELRNMEARVKESESQVDELKAELIVTKMLVEQLQRENSVLTTDLMSLETRLTATERRTSDLVNENADLQTRLSSSESELLISKSKIDELERENADLQTRLSKSESELVISTSRIDQLERENAEKPKVAFYAGLSSERYVGPYNTDVTLKYSKVFTNIGNAYNSSTGFFIAPVKGVYYLQFTLSSEQEGDMGAYVYKNNRRIMFNVKWHKDFGFVYITNSVVLELLAGDVIHLVLPSGFSLIDDEFNHSTFSGALLFPL